MSTGKTMPARTVKKIKFAVLLFYLSLFLGLALYDEKPDPELAREMAQPQPDILEPGNAWVAFLGLAAPEGMSPYDWGADKMRKLQDAVSTGKSFRECYSSVDDSKSRLPLWGNMPYFYCPKDGGILAYAAAHPDEIAEFLSNNREMLRRYDSLRISPRYNEPLDGYYAPVISFISLRNAQRIKQLQLCEMASQGDVAGALSGLRNDADFWRFIAENAKTLISKFIAVYALQNDLRFAAELGTSRSLNKQELETVREILRPFNNGETSLVGAVRGETRYGQKGMELSTWRELKKWSTDRFFIKRNATYNRMYAYAQEYMRMAELTPRQFADELKWREANEKSSPRIGLPFLYNSAGECLALMSKPNITAYISKGHNLEGLRRLSLLKVLSHQENIQPEHMQQFLNSHAAELGNPYTGAPMIWDSKKRSILFHAIAGEKSIDISISSVRLKIKQS